MRFKSFISLVIGLAACNAGILYAQTTDVTESDRRELLENEFKGRSPLIIYGMDTLSRNEFVGLKDANTEIVVLHGDTARMLYGDYAKDGAIQVWDNSINERFEDWRDALDSISEIHYNDSTLYARLLKVAMIRMFPDGNPVLQIGNWRHPIRDFMSFTNYEGIGILPAKLGLYGPDTEEDKRGVIFLSVDLKTFMRMDQIRRGLIPDDKQE